jgi:3-oxoacyl-[acyl-carrier-protein] synthase III
MQIAGLGFSYPSIKLDNEELVSLFRRQGPSVSNTDEGRYFDLVRKLLRKSGARYRHVRDIASGESAYDHICNAANEALSSAALTANDVDLVIYCGVGRGVIEPSNACYYANELGIRRAQCFDITDACMSWTRALQLCEMYLSSGQVDNALVLTGEFHLNIRDPITVRSIESLSYSFPVYTIGEAATATVLRASSSKWTFRFSSRPDLFDLCTIPIDGYETYILPSRKIGLNGVGRFTSHGKQLARHVGPMLLELVADAGPSHDDVDLYVPHSHSKTSYVQGLEAAGIPLHKVCLEIYENYGNVVSSSIPAALHCSVATGTVGIGSRICLIPSSAGASCACVTFTL